MKRCAHCRGRFGLIRYTAYRAFGSIIQFCCKKCERGYFDERRKESQSSRYRDSGEANFPSAPRVKVNELLNIEGK